jgi:HAD superfamily hydrolase (TIGR01509 family)
MSRDAPQALLWDVMGTLVYDPFHEVVPRFFGMTLGELIEAKHPRAWIDFELGATDEQTMIQRFFRDRRSFDHQGLKAAMVAAYRWLDGVEPLVARLAAAGWPMVALSNYPEWYQLIEDKLGIGRHIDWRFVSCRTGVRKPDPRAYEDAAESLGLRPDRLLFIDDRQANTDGARAVGLDTILFRDAAQLTEELAQRGIPE